MTPDYPQEIGSEQKQERNDNDWPVSLKISPKDPGHDNLLLTSSLHHPRLTTVCGIADLLGHVPHKLLCPQYELSDLRSPTNQPRVALSSYFIPIRFYFSLALS
jgi:hypothetical protein